MSFIKIKYADLNARQKEIYNFQKVAAILAEYGFNCIKLADDWHGADFLAYHINGDNTLKVQLKARITIDKKYIGKDIYITFPYREHWYLLQHDLLVEKANEHTNWLNSDSWINRGNKYDSIAINRNLLESISEYRL